MNHFYPTNYQNLSFYNPAPSSAREAQYLEVRVFFYHKAKLRVPYRQQDIYNMYEIPVRSRQNAMSLDPTNIKSSHQAHVGHNEDHGGVDSDSESG